MIQEFLTYRLSILQKKLDYRSTQILLRDYDLRLNEWRVLANLTADSGTAVRALAERISIDKSQISRALSTLVRKKFVIRAADPTDARSPLFILTTIGSEQCRRVLAARLVEQELLLGVMSPAEQQTLFSILGRLDAFLDQVKLEPSTFNVMQPTETTDS